jgi:hypothetical protein
MRSLLLTAAAVVLLSGVALACPNGQTPATSTVSAPAAVAFAATGATAAAPIVAVPQAQVLVPQAAIAVPVQSLTLAAPVVALPAAAASAVSVLNASSRCRPGGLLAELALERQVARQARAAVRQSRKTGSAAAAIAVGRN